MRKGKAAKMIIEAPRGRIFIDKTGNKAVLEWNEGFGDKWSNMAQSAQDFVDAEVLRMCEPYVPMDTGMLVMSGRLHTEIGTGWVIWKTPYARYQYYLKRKTKSERGPLRGSYWFSRMMKSYPHTIRDGAAKFYATRKGSI